MTYENTYPKNHMTREMVKEARARAKKAGRPYPNLIDNAAVIEAAKKEKSRKRSRTESFYPKGKNNDD